MHFKKLPSPKALRHSQLLDGGVESSPGRSGGRAVRIHEEHVKPPVPEAVATSVTPIVKYNARNSAAVKLVTQRRNGLKLKRGGEGVGRVEAAHCIILGNSERQSFVFHIKDADDHPNLVPDYNCRSDNTGP
ncbi:hypothetical protein EVAR_90616_1 [Eumeta japonica]|uniref:Uncharacterized protein n=1 Tax=Eumeta variegata TaxID=151549 RepID=A0A4C1ZWI1_EUMVA|nr:hypothetical protein EVAR_90616_1 [Eumeta japonica]